MNNGSSGFFLYSSYLILSNRQNSENQKSSKSSFSALKMLQRIQTLFLLFCRSLVIDKLLVMHSMLGQAMSHASAVFRNKELVHKMWNQRSGLRGTMVHLLLWDQSVSLEDIYCYRKRASMLFDSVVIYCLHCLFCYGRSHSRGNLRECSASCSGAHVICRCKGDWLLEWVVCKNI